MFLHAFKIGIIFVPTFFLGGVTTIIILEKILILGRTLNTIL